jgi:hypothetical protein
MRLLNCPPGNIQIIQKKKINQVRACGSDLYSCRDVRTQPLHTMMDIAFRGKASLGGVLLALIFFTAVFASAQGIVTGFHFGHGGGCLRGRSSRKRRSRLNRGSSRGRPPVLGRTGQRLSRATEHLLTDQHVSQVWIVIVDQLVKDPYLVHLIVPCSVEHLHIKRPLFSISSNFRFS